MAWAKNGTPNTLSGTSDTITISDLTSTKFNQLISHQLASGNISADYRLGNGSIDSGSNYSSRVSDDGGTDGTATSDNRMRVHPNGAGADIFNTGYIVNIATEEKLAMSFSIDNSGTGAGNAPSRREGVSKWVNTSNQFDQAQVYNSQTGNYTVDSNLSALTGDETETVTLQDGTIFEETDTNKAYIWSSSSETWTQL